MSLSRDSQLKVVDFIFNKFNFSLAVIIISVLLFHEKFEKMLTDFIVSDYLSKIKTGDINTLFLVFISFLIIIYFRGKYLRKYYYSGKIVVFYSVIVGFYTFYRLFSDVWHFSKLNTNEFIEVAYLDICYFLLIPVISYFRHKHGKKKKTENTVESNIPKLIIDSPILNKQNDSLNRENIADQISQVIKEIDSPTSFAVGITSKWGDGKTSFINLLSNQLNELDKTAIHLHFSPWYCKSEIDIISLFFDTLSDKLKIYHSSINNQINKYSKLLLSLKKHEFVDYIEKGKNLFSESNDLAETYDKLNKSIGSLNRKIYITIDDIDRLYAKEILECFKIIRNTANFKNVIYIVAYDPNYVDKALEDGLKNYSKGFIDKIIQLPFQLPVIEDVYLLNYLEDKLEDYNIDENFKRDLRSGKRLNVKDYILNIRECNKIINLFITYKHLLGNEIEVFDLFLICILKTVFPSESLDIYSNYDEYFTFINKRLEFRDLNMTHQKQFLRDHMNNENKEQPIYKIDSHNNEQLKNLVISIFLKENSTFKSACENNNYFMYYNGVLPNNFLSNVDFQNALNSFDDMKKLIDDMNQNKFSNFTAKLNKLRLRDFDKLLTAIEGYLYCFNTSNLNFYDVLSFIKNNYEEGTIKILQTLVDRGSETKLVLQIANLIEVIKNPYVRKNIFLNSQILYFNIKDCNNDDEYETAIQKAKQILQDLSIQCLKIGLEQKYDTQTILDLYYLSYEHIVDGFIVQGDDSIMLMKKYAEEYPIEYLTNLIIPRYMEGNEKIKQFRPFIDQTFSNERGNYKGFTDFLSNTIKTNKDNHELLEIGNYWQLYEKSGYEMFEVNEEIK